MKTLFLILLTALALNAGAQINIVTENDVYAEDFDGLDSFGTGGTRMPVGWQFHEWGSAANASYRAGTGSGTTSDTYSFGPLRSRDRALGSLASGTLTRIVYGTLFINGTGSDINGITVSYRGEQWRRGGSGAPDSMRCYFTTVRGARLSDTGFAHWTEAPALLFESVSTLSGGATLNGNDSCRILHAEIPLMLHPGDSVLIRWCDLNAAGSDDGLAIDSLRIRFHNGPVLQGNHPQLVRFSPDSSEAGLAPDLSLHMSFDRSVRPGSGTILLQDQQGALIESIPAGSSRVRTNGRDVTINGLPLHRGDSYRVRFDSAAFDSAGFVSAGHYSGAWRFTVSKLGIEPQPAADEVSLQVTGAGCLLLKLPEDGPARVCVFSADGKCLYRRELDGRSGLMMLDPDIPAGACYFATLSVSGRFLRRKFCRP